MRANLARCLRRQERGLDYLEDLAISFGCTPPVERNIAPVMHAESQFVGLGDRDVHPFVREMIVKMCRAAGINPIGDDPAGIEKKLKDKYGELKEQFSFSSMHISKTEFQAFLRIELDPRRTPILYRKLTEQVWRVKVKPETLRKYWAYSL